MKNFTCILTLAGAAGLLAAPCAHAEEGWDWFAAPYLWATTISTDLNEDQPPVEGETNFSNLIDKLDGAFLGHVEGQGENFGLLADIVYLGVSSGEDFDRFETESDIDTSIFELAGVWSPGPERYRGIEVFGGLRYVTADLTTTISPVNSALPDARIHVDEGYSDFLLGARYSAPLSERWGVTVRGDGSFGETEGTWNTSALFTYKMGNGSWAFGWRYMAIEVEAGGSNVDLTLNGPVIGYAFGL